MGDIRWDAEARVHERDDGGSDMYYEFKTLKTGTLAEMVRHVMELPSADRARIVIDAEGVGTLNIHDIGELARRGDFPAD